MQQDVGVIGWVGLDRWFFIIPRRIVSRSAERGKEVTLSAHISGMVIRL